MTPRLLRAMAIIILCAGSLSGGAGGAADLQVRFSERVVPAPPAEAIVLPEVAAAPLIDGKLDDDCWKDAWRIDEFTVCGRPDGVVRRTAALLCRDSTGLYVAVRCIEPDPARVKATHATYDEPLADDDSVEVYLSLDGLAREVLRLTVSASGTRQDARCLAGMSFFSPPGGEVVSVDPSWDMPWRAGVHRAGNAWAVEISILTQNVGGRKAFSPGEIWWLGIRRNRVGPLWPGRSRSSAFGGGDGVEIPAMRCVRMGKPNALLDVRDSGALMSGRNRAILRLINPEARSVEMQVQAVVVRSRKEDGPSRLYGMRATVPAKGEKEIALDYDIPSAAGMYRVHFRLLDKEGKDEFVSHRFTAHGAPARLALRPVAGRILASDPLRAGVRLLTGNADLQELKLRLHLADAGGKAVATWTGKCTSDRASVVFPGGMLKPGRYELAAALLNGQDEEIFRKSTSVLVHGGWTE